MYMMSATWQDLKFLAQLVQLNSRECMHVNMDLKVRNCRLKINEVIYIREFSPLFLTGNMDKSIIQDLGTCLGIENIKYTYRQHHEFKSTVLCHAVELFPSLLWLLFWSFSNRRKVILLYSRVCLYLSSGEITSTVLSCSSRFDFCPV